MLKIFHACLIIACLSLGACSTAEKSTAEQSAPAASEWQRGAIATAANPHAVAAAIEMLERGGHAVDAAIAAHAVLGLVEPQSSGLGGGGFMLVFERGDDDLNFYDGREIAPAGATIDMFVRDGKAMEYAEAWQSGLAVGVPGAVALYKYSHNRHGRLPWAELFQPAIRLATDGFEVSPRLASFLPKVAAVGRLDENPPTAAYFYPDGEALQAGDWLVNKEYAETLAAIAEHGPDAFYRGPIAAAIAKAAQEPPNGGSLTIEDIAAYEVIDRRVICGPFRKLKICSTSPPSSGAAQILVAGLYDQFVADDTPQTERIVAFVDAQRLAYADRDHYFGDPDTIDVPIDDLLNPVYIKHRATERFGPADIPTHGDPGAVLHDLPIAAKLGPDTTQEASGTTHMSIIDNQGNAVSMTATVEAPFGSSRWAAGFLLNNEMTDFARDVPADGRQVANSIVPRKRPRSSMSPTMVFDEDGELLMVTGSPGGNSIPAYVAKTIVGILDWGLSAQDAVDFPNIVARGEKVRVEVSVEPGLEIASKLTERGYTVQEREGENSGLHVIVIRPDTLEGAADKRREGIATKIGVD